VADDRFLVLATSCERPKGA